jgi:O-antigen/teichoic acid export membrane protein
MATHCEVVLETAPNKATSLTQPEPRVPEESSVSRRFLVRLARGAVFALIIQVLGAGLTYLSQIVFARWMGISQFGVYAYLTAWTTILALLAGLGFPLSVLRFIPEYRAHGDYQRLRGVIRLSRRATLATGVGVAVIGTVIALLVTPSKTTTAVALAVWLIPAGALINLDVAIIRAGGRVIGAFAPSLVIRPLLILLAAGTIWLISKQLTASTGFMITLCAFGIVALLQSKFVREIVRHGEPPYSTSYDRRVWFRVSVPLLLVASFQIAIGQTDLLIVGAVRGVRYAGPYLAASKTVSLVGYLLIAFSAVAAPLFSELWTKGDRTGLQHLATVAAQWVFWPTLLISLMLALLSPYILGLFGPDFVVAQGALLILLVGQLVGAGCGAVGYLLSMTGHQNDMARVSGIIAAFNVAVCYAAVKAFGLDGAACATTTSVIIFNLWLHHLTVKRIGVRASILSSLALRRTRRTQSDRSL